MDDSARWNAPMQGQSQAYVTALLSAGAEPVFIAIGGGPEMLEAALARVDGLLFAGGGDVHPKYYGQEPHPKLGILEPERDEAELFLARKALQNRIPLMAICRGIQLLAVAGGGTLIQDIHAQRPDAFAHPAIANDQWCGPHEVVVDEGSRLARALGRTRFAVNSGHHQAVDQVGPGFRVVARAPDGMVEGIEADSHFVLGTQFHPEKVLHETWAQSLFQALAAAAREHMG